MIFASMHPFLAIIKSSGDPLINIAGAYFPGWLACMISGLLGTWILYIFFQRLGLASVFYPSIIIFPASFTAITCWTWIFYFAAR